MTQATTTAARAACLALLASLGACSVLEPDKIDYKSAGKGISLEVPPDLTQLARDSRYQMPGGSVTATGSEAARPATAASGQAVASNAVGDVRIERDGNQRWLVIERPADNLWQPLRDIWQENGFLLAIDQPNIGVMETDWAENRAKIPQDLIRRTIGKVFDNLYSTGERDKFRTRVERRADGRTEIFVSHRGMIETYTTSRNDTTAWEPRPSDPELEAEFLRRMMVKLGGVSEEASKAQVAASSAGAAPAAQVGSDNGVPVVQLGDDFDRAWRRVGLSLDRTGFTVEDRDRSQGLYYVRYIAPNAQKAAEPGFFGRIFGRGAKTVEPDRYRIQVKSQGGTSVVSVLKADGTPETSANARRIAQVLADDLK